MDSSRDDRLQALRQKLAFFFMDPLKKWKTKKKKPWKLLIQVLKIIIFTLQLLVFGNDMSKFVSYKYETQVTLKQLLLKDYDPSAEASPFPAPDVPYSLYTQDDYFDYINHAIKRYANIRNISVAPFVYQSKDIDIASPVDICVTNYLQADFDSSKNSYNFSLYPYTECTSIRNLTNWENFDIKATIKSNFNTLIMTTIKLPLRTLLVEDSSSQKTEVICFNIDVMIYLDNMQRDGQMKIRLESVPKAAHCNGTVTSFGRNMFFRRCLNLVVMAFCSLSFILCIRSLVKAYKLSELTRCVFLFHGKVLHWNERLEFIDPWLVLIIINDMMIMMASNLLTFYDDKLLETDNYALCSFLMGIGNFLSWVGLLRYLSFFKRYNLLLVTLKKSFSHVIRFMLCTMIIYW